MAIDALGRPWRSWSLRRRGLVALAVITWLLTAWFSLPSTRQTTQLLVVKALAERQLATLGEAAQLDHRHAGGHPLAVRIVDDDPSQRLRTTFHQALANSHAFVFEENAPAMVNFELWRRDSVMVVRSKLWRRGWTLLGPIAHAEGNCAWLPLAWLAIGLTIAAMGQGPMRALTWAGVGAGLSSYWWIARPLAKFAAPPSLRLEHRDLSQLIVSAETLTWLWLFPFVAAMLWAASRRVSRVPVATTDRRGVTLAQATGLSLGLWCTADSIVASGLGTCAQAILPGI